MSIEKTHATKNKSMEMQSYQNFLDQKPSKGDLKKLEIIQAAIECISSIGFEKTTYQAIAEKVGTRRAHIAYHFKDKSDIFKASIQYINGNYQRILTEQLEEAQPGIDTIIKYASSPFVWAEQNPNELSVMLLFYYLCTIDPEYRALNDDLRKRGVERILLVLTQECRIELMPVELELKAKQIQNLISGSIMDAVTTQHKSLKQAKDETIKNITNLLEKV